MVPTTGSRESPLIMALAAALLSIKKMTSFLVKRSLCCQIVCKDCEDFRCHDGMCELPVVQQTRGDVVPVTQRSDNIVVKQLPSKAGALFSVWDASE